MSRRPGIGYPAVQTICETLNTSFGALALARAGDVPTALQVGADPLPLGGYLRRKLREELFADAHQPTRAKELIREREKAAVAAEVPDLYKVAPFSRIPNEIAGQVERRLSEEKTVKRQFRAEQLKARYQLAKQRKKL